MMEHPLILEAMTLRGLGSYLHGAHLEIRPLTILCGTNGSGKSTWFRILKILQDSINSGRLPFSFEDDIGCGEGETHDCTNPLARMILSYAAASCVSGGRSGFRPVGNGWIARDSRFFLQFARVVS